MTATCGDDSGASVDPVGPFDGEWILEGRFTSRQDPDQELRGEISMVQGEPTDTPVMTDATGGARFPFQRTFAGVIQGEDMTGTWMWRPNNEDLEEGTSTATGR